MVKYIFILFIVWRLSLIISAALGTQLLDFAPRFPYADVYLIPSGLPQWLWSFANFDGVHYLTIAKSGYSAQYTQVFFPLFPLLLRSVNLILHVSPILTGLLISNGAFLVATYLFLKLMLLDYKIEVVKRAVLILMFFPTVFFFGSLYTESLFFTLVLGAFIAARLRRWWLAGILGGMASATRLVGIFLLPALLWEQIQQCHPVSRSIRDEGSHPYQEILQSLHSFRMTLHIILHSPILYLVPLGLLSYMVYLFIEHNDPLYFWHVQPVFGASRAGIGLVLLPQVFFRYIKILMSVSYSSSAFFTAVLEVLATIVAIIYLVVAHIRKVRLSYLIFSWFAVVTPTLTGTFSSMPRYILVAFPIYISLALQIRTKAATITYVLLSFLLLFLLTVMFASGRWVA